MKLADHMINIADDKIRNSTPVKIDLHNTSLIEQLIKEDKHLQKIIFYKLNRNLIKAYKKLKAEEEDIEAEKHFQAYKKDMIQNVQSTIEKLQKGMRNLGDELESLKILLVEVE